MVAKRLLGKICTKRILRGVSEISFFCNSEVCKSTRKKEQTENKEDDDEHDKPEHKGDIAFPKHKSHYIAKWDTKSNTHCREEE
jgi:hypothetical protein